MHERYCDEIPVRKLHWNEDEDDDNLVVEVIDIPHVDGTWDAGLVDDHPPRKWIHHCPVEDDYTQVDWWYRNRDFPTEAVNRGERFDWETFRLQTVAAARARAIQLANGDGIIDTFVSQKSARAVQKYMHEGTAACEAGLDAHAWGGAPIRGANDVRTWPLIFMDQYVLRVADHDDGFALYGRRSGPKLPPFIWYDSVEDCERALEDEGLTIGHFELYGRIPENIKLN